MNSDNSNNIIDSVSFQQTFLQQCQLSTDMSSNKLLRLFWRRFLTTEISPWPRFAASCHAVVAVVAFVAVVAVVAVVIQRLKGWLRMEPAQLSF